MATTMTMMATRVEPDLRAEVTAWRRVQDPIPPISEAVRELIRLGLQASRQNQQHNKKIPNPA